MGEGGNSEEAPSTDVTISKVTVKGVTATIDETDPTIYNVELPNGTVLADLTVADIVVTATDLNAHVAEAIKLDNGATWTIEVTAEDGTTTETYTINVTVAEDPAIEEANQAIASALENV